MRSKDVLKSALMAYDGTVIVVSHDREFLDGLVEKVYEFSDGKVREHLGGIYDFLRRKKMESLKELEVNSRAEKNVKVKSDSDQKRLWEERKEIDKQTRRVEGSLSKVEANIAKLEEEIAVIDRMLENPEANGVDMSDTEFFHSYDEKKRDLEKLMQQWEDITLELEELKEKRNTLQ